MKSAPAVGTSVRIASRCTANGRTGVVTETAKFWADMAWVRVELDPPGLISWSIFPPHELEPIRVIERPGKGQADLFGGVA
jgi:hypothetical protein